MITVIIGLFAIQKNHLNHGLFFIFFEIANRFLERGGDAPYSRSTCSTAIPRLLAMSFGEIPIFLRFMADAIFSASALARSSFRPFSRPFFQACFQTFFQTSLPTLFQSFLQTSLPTLFQAGSSCLAL